MDTRSSKRRSATERATPRATPERAASGTAKRARNLSLSLEAISRGDDYSRAHGTTLSALVEQYLRGLPKLDDREIADDCVEVDRGAHELADARARSSSPLVRELAGFLTNGSIDTEEEDPREVFREHLRHRYGGA